MAEIQQIQKDEILVTIVNNRRNFPAEIWLKAMAERGNYEDDICISAVVPMTVLHKIDTEVAIARIEK